MEENVIFCVNNKFQPEIRLKRIYCKSNRFSTLSCFGFDDKFLKHPKLNM